MTNIIMVPIHIFRMRYAACHMSRASWRKPHAAYCRVINVSSPQSRQVWFHKSLPINNLLKTADTTEFKAIFTAFTYGKELYETICALVILKNYVNMRSTRCDLLSSNSSFICSFAAPIGRGFVPNGWYKDAFLLLYNAYLINL